MFENLKVESPAIRQERRMNLIGEKLNGGNGLSEQTCTNNFEGKNSENLSLLGFSGSEFINADFEQDEAILFGVRRGQVGSLIAPTHVGKTLFLLNLMLTLAAGRRYPPFINEASRDGIRVMFIDGESSRKELQFLLNRMMGEWTETEREKAMNNCFLFCDEEIDNETLNLSKPQHLKMVEQSALLFKPDLILVDPVTALFDIKNENDNAEVKSKIMKPLKNLGKRQNAAVLYSHHIGKMTEEANTATKAYGGRGGSAFGGLSRTVISLTADKHDKNKRIFSMPKIKGIAIDDTVLKLDSETFWFTPTNEQAPKIETSYTRIVALIDREITTSEIIKEGEKIGLRVSTIEKCLKDAISRQDIKSVRRGVYAPIESVTSVTPIAVTEITETNSSNN